MKKTITITMIVILLLNLIYVPSFAVGELDPTKPMSTEPQEKGNVKVTNDEGKSTLAGISGTTHSGGQVAKTLAVVLTVPPRAVSACLDLFVYTTTGMSSSSSNNQFIGPLPQTETGGLITAPNYQSNANNTANTGNDRFTIYDLVLGHYPIFNIDFTEELPEDASKADTFMERVKIDVMKFYVFTRNLSIAISLFVLIYMGIRMAISTVASEQAKYKKMLIDWVASLVILFFMHFIIIIISVLLQAGLQLFEKLAVTWNLQSFEQDIYDHAVTNLSSHGWNAFTSVVLIWMLTWYQVKFFLYYLHRTLEVHFLVIVAPLVTITYPIDKAGDSKAQAFGNLIKEIILKCSMQLIHTIVYLVFIGTAGVIAVSQPILAIVFFMALSRAEKITRNIIGAKDEGFEKTQVPFAS